jgi:hypothetical protein
VVRLVKVKSMTRSVVVFGTSHRLQGAQNYKGSIDAPSYSVLLEQLISDRAIDFIFEEASGCGPTIAQNLAGRIPYLDVDPHPNRRKEHGLSPDTGTGFKPINPNDPDMLNDFFAEQYVEPQAQREEFWLHRIEEQNFSRGLVICGFLHALSLAFKLQSAQFKAESLVYIPYDRLCSHPKRNLTSD